MRKAIDEIWNHGVLDMADSLFAASYVNHGGLIPDLVHGPESVKVGVALFRMAFPRLQVAVDQLTTVGETIMVRWTARAEPLKQAVGGDTTDHGDAMTGVTRVRFSEGQIVESWTDWDQAAALGRLDLVPAPAVG